AAPGRPHPGRPHRPRGAVVATLRWGTATDPGRIRPDNEDNLLAGPQVFAVADGMGGHRAGEVASAIAVDLLRARLGAPGADLETVIAAISEANGSIYRAANGNPDQQGMGTTVTALVVITDRRDAPGATTSETLAAEPDAGDDPGAGASTEPAPATPAGEQLALVNVGDSRTYLLRHGRLRRVTVDHSYVQELVATGNITDDEARTHPRRNIVTRALGIDPSVRVDAWTLPLVRGDRFLLCSDGLVDEVVDDEIVAVLDRVGDPQAAADELVAIANAQGGRDNITVVVVDVVEGLDPPDPDSELDLEPAWDDADDAVWATADADADATEFEDLAALVHGDEPETAEAGSPTDGTAAIPTTAAAASTAPVPADADRVPVVTEATTTRRRKRRLGGFLAVIGVIAVLVLAFVIASAWARRGYFVAFDEDDIVVVYRGQSDGFLWFDPTVDAPTRLTRDALDDASVERVEREPRFDSRSSAERFVVEQLETTTTSTTTTTTTTTVPPTTTPPTTAAP
ncbi:MAG: PP2C family serine/threonine-protein phosphatase, partial [Ilumatobacteraceae bacterium]